MQQAQAKIITDLADKGSCVIVGRGGDYVLRDREDALHVFIHADMQFRAQRVVSVYGDNGQKPEQRLRDWGAVHNYDIALDSGRLGLDACVEAIITLVKGE